MDSRFIGALRTSSPLRLFVWLVHLLHHYKTTVSIYGERKSCRVYRELMTIRRMLEKFLVQQLKKAPWARLEPWSTALAGSFRVSGLRSYRNSTNSRRCIKLEPVLGFLDLLSVLMFILKIFKLRFFKVSCDFLTWRSALGLRVGLSATSEAKTLNAKDFIHSCNFAILYTGYRRLGERYENAVASSAFQVYDFSHLAMIITLVDTILESVAICVVVNHIDGAVVIMWAIMSICHLPGV